MAVPTRDISSCQWPAAGVESSVVPTSYEEPVPGESLFAPHDASRITTRVFSTSSVYTGVSPSRGSRGGNASSRPSPLPFRLLPDKVQVMLGKIVSYLRTISHQKS